MTSLLPGSAKRDLPQQGQLGLVTACPQHQSLFEPVVVTTRFCGPENLEVHLTHKTPSIQHWLAQHSQIAGLSLSLRSNSTGDVSEHPELEQAIDHYIIQHNAHPKPFDPLLAICTTLTYIL
jgi:hypothetical protein